MELNFRTLTANEIECRVNQITETGLSLLLYKDARCDMNLLDETVGPMNWIRTHSRDNANCTVSIFDENRGMWVSKEDTGAESNTEAAKGLASDSFKRACVNWGIGRELYSAPFIWVPAGSYKTKQARNGKLSCADSFRVEHVTYTATREISALVIVNQRTNQVVFSMGAKPASLTTMQTKTEVACSICGAEITPLMDRDRLVPVSELVARSTQKYGKPVCAGCAVKMNGNQGN